MKNNAGYKPKNKNIDKLKVFLMKKNDSKRYYNNKEN